MRYHGAVHPVAERLLTHLRRQEFLKAGDRVGVAVSGGVDSVALLRLLLELRHTLGIVLSVVHFNHKLRGTESDADQEFVAALAREHDVELFLDSGDVAGYAAREHLSIETAARELRYAYFRRLLGAAPGLKPHSKEAPLRGPEGPLFHGAGHGAAKAVPLPSLSLNPVQGQDFPTAKLRSAGQPGAAVPTRELPGQVPTMVRTHPTKIATGHTLDDQAETVLMRLIRGTGLRGLAGIHPRIAVGDHDGEFCGEIIRPLLATRRSELETYLSDLKQSWREDSSNAEHKFTRNRVRRQILPLLEQFNPSIAENLSELAEIARGEEDYWENEAAGWQGSAVQWTEPDWAREARERAAPAQMGTNAQSDELLNDSRELHSRMASAPRRVMNASISRAWLRSEPLAVQRRVIKSVGDQAGIALEFKHVEEILRFVAEEGANGKELSLPAGWKLVCEPESLLFVTPDLRGPQGDAADFEYALALPGKTQVPEANMLIETRRLGAGADASAYNPDELLDADALQVPLRVRNWRPGDRFWPAHTKAPKKIKELLQERHLPLPERKLWPVVVSEDEIVWLRGFAVPEKWRAKLGRAAVVIVVKQEGLSG
ncbi:MAG TPA: tRNA lysidine(34) synthetase TilS [Candidatus Sulfotelmatobacter sp.]|nr:tRNA lysidine(34) synthetase TilS [Candidatus Sulfotelmatobacter sp.]